MNKNKGITLIALVITIIVLLILAGVAIVTLSGDNGILGKAQSAKNNTDESQELEQIQLAVTTAKTNENSTIDKKMLKQELKNIPEIVEGLPENDDEAEEKAFPWIVTGKSGQMYKITDKGEVFAKVTLPKGLEIGSIVNYTPSGTYTWKANYYGGVLNNNKDQTLDSSNASTFQIKKWKVFKIDEYMGEVQLVPENTTKGSVTLYGSTGYNNGIKLLNDACSELYGTKAKGVTARSINIEDIESVMEYDPNTYKGDVEYGKNYSTEFTVRNSNYPKRYEIEKDRKINGKEEKDGLGLSEQKEFIEISEDRYITGNTIWPKQTFYKLEYNDFKKELTEKYEKILLPNDQKTSYWVASHCINVRTTYSQFINRSVSDGQLTSNTLFFSNFWTTNVVSHPLFPVVSLSAELIKENNQNEFSV